MGVMNLIRQQKKGFRQLQADRSAAHNVAAAEELKVLREKRIKAEGKAKLARLQQQERAKLATAQQTVRDQSKGRRFAKNLAKFMNEGKTKLNQMKSQSSGPGFDPGVGKSNPFGGGKGFNPGGFAGGFNTGPASKITKKPVKVVTRYYNK